MPTYKTPGVYFEEIPKFPPSIAAVETAIPAFIGFTEKADKNGDSLVKVPVRLTSLLEFEEIFGKANVKNFEVKVEQTKLESSGQIIETTPSFQTAPGEIPDKFLHYAMQMFFGNGGGPCYVISIGDYSTVFNKTLFTDVFAKLDGYDEPTLLVFLDACLGNDTDHADIVNAALAHCAKMQDRFAIIDVRNAVSGGTDDIADVTTNFRGKVVSNLKYGAAYFPYLKTSIPFYTDDEHVTVKTHKVNTLKTDKTTTAAKGQAHNKKLSHQDVKEKENVVYNAVKRFVSNATVTIPPSAAVAGVYARVDKSRGVWKAPANVSIRNVITPAIRITNDLNNELNIDATSGKSVNAIRSFTGKGTLVWGSRTLAGNDKENRYVPVRRFLNFAEESIKKAIGRLVFEPNDANTWTKVGSMVENFLILQWRDGALQGAKPEDAFFVTVGLNKTMSAQDILDGRMIVEIGLAIVHPAEFIVLRIVQMMPKS